MLVENFLPGKLETMNLGYEDLSRQNPQLIYCSISGARPRPSPSALSRFLICLALLFMLNMIDRQGFVYVYVRALHSASTRFKS